MVLFHVLARIIVYLGTIYLGYGREVYFLSFQVPCSLSFHRMLFASMRLQSFRHSSQNHRSLYFHLHLVVNFQANFKEDNSLLNLDEWYDSYVGSLYLSKFKKSRQKPHFQGISCTFLDDYIKSHFLEVLSNESYMHILKWDRQIPCLQNSEIIS